MTLPSTISIDTPAWLTDASNGLPDTLPTPQDRMRAVLSLAERNHREGTGGPFAALVVDTTTGQPLAAGVNLVLASGLSSAHAEVTAICLAQIRLGRWDLGADASHYELVVNWRPCAMCYGATLWSGVRQLTIAGDGPELEDLTGFDEGPMRPDWADQLQCRGITVNQNVLRDEAVDLFRRYGSRTDTVVYNARDTGARIPRGRS